MAIKPVGGFLKSSKTDIVGFDLTEDHLKLVHVKVTKLKREVMHLVSHEVRGMSDDDIAFFIKQTLFNLKIKNPSGYMAVPLNLVITRCIEIPSKDPDEIQEIVNLQASRHTPYSRSEIIVDMLILGLARENYSKVLLVIVPKDIVTRQVQILDKANLKLEKVFFPPEGICTACTKILNNESSESATAAVHMDSSFTSFIVIQKGKIVFVRGISIGAYQLLDEKDVYKDRFVDELQKSLESYQQEEAGPPPTQLVLTGVVAEITDLDDIFSETLHMPIKHQAYFDYFAISQEAYTVASASKHISFFNVIAPLLLYDKMKIDLVPDDRKLRKELEHRGREMMKTGLLVMMLLMLSFGLFASKIYFKSAYLSQLTARYQPIRNEAKDLEDAFVKIQAVKNHLSKKGSSIESLPELYDAIPNDVRLNSIRYEDGQRFTVKGVSKTMASVFSFVSNLEKSSKFKNVKTKYVTTRNEAGIDVADFEITSAIDEPGGAS